MNLKMQLASASLIVLLLGGCRPGGDDAAPAAASPPAPTPAAQSTVVMPAPVGAPVPVTLPADDAAHDEQLVEWWQWWAHLKTEDGRQIGAMIDYSSKVSPLIRYWEYGLRIADVGARTSQSSGSKWLAQVTHIPDGFDLAARPGQWAKGGNGHDTLHFEQGNAVFDLEIVADKPAVMLFNADGVFRADNADLHLYQRQRMRTTGWMTENGHKFRVSGTTWFEHGYATMTTMVEASWDYFQMELADGRNIQLMQLKRFKGGPDALWQGEIAKPDGSVTYLSGNGLGITQTGFWQRDAACSYPVNWHLRVKDEHFDMTAVAANQEVPSVGLWDGEMHISGAAPAMGSAETINYCPLPQLP